MGTKAMLLAGTTPLNLPAKMFFNYSMLMRANKAKTTVIGCKHLGSQIFMKDLRCQ